jgi:hypothetical protein
MVTAFNQGARAAGGDPGTLGKRVELFAIVGDQKEIHAAAELWRFTGARHDLDQPNPLDIQHAADAAAPINKVAGGWTTGTDPRNTRQRGADHPHRRRHAVPALPPARPSSSTAPRCCRSCAKERSSTAHRRRLSAHRCTTCTHPGHDPGAGGVSALDGGPSGSESGALRRVLRRLCWHGARRPNAIWAIVHDHCLPDRQQHADAAQ